MKTKEKAKSFTRDSYIVAGGGHTLTIGNAYEVRHSRKGTFDMRITAIGDEWITGVILKGRAKHISKEIPDGRVGDTITVRDVLTYFIPIT